VLSTLGFRLDDRGSGPPCNLGANARPGDPAADNQDIEVSHS
jgi:hypothetical protein